MGTRPYLGWQVGLTHKLAVAPRFRVRAESMSLSNGKRPTLRRRPVKHVPTPTKPAAASPIPAVKRFVFKGDVLERIGVSYPCLWRWMRDGKFPVALEVGGRCAWLESDID